MHIDFVKDDGGRSEAGFTGQTDDCVTRAITIATGLPYREVYDALFERGRRYHATRGAGMAGAELTRAATPRTGILRKVYEPYLEWLGWTWTPTMHIGQGATVHLRADELPAGNLVVRLSRHVAAVIDGVLHDSFDCSREGTRCVYGYYRAA